jgi:hypothetical protein
MATQQPAGLRFQRCVQFLAAEALGQAVGINIDVG